MQEVDASFGLWAWPNIVICTAGLILVVTATRGKWLRVVDGLKGASIAILVMLICFLVLGDPHLAPP